MQHFVITGGAGFIGSNLIRALLKQQPSCTITCIDNLDSFYAIEIKKNNLAEFANETRFRFLQFDIANNAAENLLELIPEKVDVIIHLAAKAGVRPSIANPLIYQKNNIIGTQNLLDFAKLKNCTQFIFASSSSVYGNNTNFPWNENEKLLPISPYAMTKLSGEMLGHIFHKLYGIRFIALRFFTAYGPGQRPDLAIHKFLKNILNNEPIPIFGNGTTSRDYTYIDDIISALLAAIVYTKTNFEIINIGNNYSIALKDLVAEIEKTIGKKAVLHYMPEQPGEVFKTMADITKAMQLLNYQPQMQLHDGLNLFYEWLLKNKEILNP